MFPLGNQSISSFRPQHRNEKERKSTSDAVNHDIGEPGTATENKRLMDFIERSISNNKCKSEYHEPPMSFARVLNRKKSVREPGKHCVLDDMSTLAFQYIPERWFNG